MSVSELKVLLRREETLRLSEDTQARYGEVECSHGQDDWLCVTETLQQNLLREAGVPSERMAASLFLMRAASQLFEDDPELCGPRAISLYVRHQRAERGLLRAGDAAPDLPLHHLDGTTTSVTVMCSGASRTLLVAGSFT